MKFIIITISFIFSSFSFGQEIIGKIDSLARKFGTSNRYADSNYVKYYDELGVHLYSSLHFSSFVLSDNFTDNKLVYGVPISPSIGVGFNKYGLSLNLANDFGVVTQNTKKYGETKKLIVNSSFTYKKLALNIYMNVFSGYYLANPDDFPIYNDSTDFPQRSDIKTYGFGMSNIHVLNAGKFSLNSAYKLTQKQLKSAGSIVLGESFNMFFIKGDDSFIPDSLINQFSPYSNLDKSSNYIFSFLAGYSYNFVFLKDFNFNITALPNLNVAISTKRIIDPNLKSNTNVSFIPSFAIKSGVAYVKDRIYIGANVLFNDYRINIGNESTIQFNMLSFRFFTGYRIGSLKEKKQ